MVLSDTKSQKIVELFLMGLCLLHYSFMVSANTCSDHIIYEEGNSAIILTASHGAAKSRLLPGVPLRKGGEFKGFVTRSDQYTDLLTWRIAALLKQQGLSPFVVVAGVHRSQVDFNRPAPEAYESSQAEICYQRYHSKVSGAIRYIKQKWGNGLLIDVHGQSRYNYDLIKGTRNNKTIRHLVEYYGEDVTEMNDGLFTILRNKKYTVSPEKNKKERYFYGGYTVQQYGSHQLEGIDAIQIELGRSIRVDSKKREKLAKDMTEAIYHFYQRYYSGVEWN